MTKGFRSDAPASGGALDARVPSTVSSPLTDGAAVDVERLYGEQAALLVEIARRKFGIPVEEAVALAHDVFVNYIRYRDEVDNPRAWLIGAMVKASCYHLRKAGRTDFVAPAELEVIADEGSSDSLELVHRSILVQQLLGCIGGECRDVLRMHYLEGRTANELASILGTTEGYAKKMVHKCLVRARELYGKLRSTT